jgi:transmembrane sensor
MITATDSARLSIAEEAAEWFVANREGSLDPVQRATFAAWLKTSPMHVEEYLGIALLARDLRAAADPEVSLEALLAQARSSHEADIRPLWSGRAHLARRPKRAPWRFAAAAAAIVAAIAFAALWWGSDHVAMTQYTSRHGERITERLADNSVLQLDTDTSVTVRYSRAQRLVEVERGQVLFEVAHEPGRPFRVIAGSAEVVAVGTRFDVYLQRDSTLVTVLEGQVAVALAPQERGATAGRMVPVRAGEQIRVAAGELPAEAAPAQMERNTAWLRRQIVFEQEPLGAVAEEFSRYSATPIEIESASLRALLISGTFSADDTESFVAFLRTLEGVRVEATSTRIRVSRM